MSDLSAHTEVKVGSEKSFGVTFMVVFTIIAVFPVLFGGHLRIWALLIGVVFGVLGVLAPGTLKTPNLLWFKFGMLLNSVVSPLVMGIIFFLVVTPIGLIRRMTTKDPLKTEIDKEADTYWITRTEQDNQSDMTKQF